MSDSTYHILNGDCLSTQLSFLDSESKIVCRECLADGDIAADDLDGLFAIRERFIRSSYEGCETADYYGHCVSEFDRVHSIQDGAEICFWFEHDVFCLVNFLFMAYLVSLNKHSHTFYFAQPLPGFEYSFAQMSEEQLRDALVHRIELPSNDLTLFAEMWTFAQRGDADSLLSCANQVSDSFSFLMPAVTAYCEMISSDEQTHPIRVLLQTIVRVYPDADFSFIFREFQKQAPLYGFGDLQIKHLLAK